MKRRSPRSRSPGGSVTGSAGWFGRGAGLVFTRGTLNPHSLRAWPAGHAGFSMLVAAAGWLLLAPCSSAGAAANIVVGQVRVQLLSENLTRLEVRGAQGFEERTTFHVLERNWPGVAYASNLIAGEAVIATPNYVVHVPQAATSLTGVHVDSPDARVLYRYNGTLTNSVWLPGPADNPAVWSFADTPRIVPPAWGLTPAPTNSPWPATSGWDLSNNAPDVYVFVPGGNYRQLRSDFLKLTGPTEMVPLFALGAFDSRYYEYSETTALQQIDDYRARRIPLDTLVVDTDWRVGASTGYQPNTNLFPNMTRFFQEAHARHARIMFNDHPQPVAATALDPVELQFRYAGLAGLLGEGLDFWWYDRNWSVSLLTPAPGLRKEVWGMRMFHDMTQRTNTQLRPLIMANVDGIDNGIRNTPPSVAAHRFPIQWTGDTGPDANYLERGIKNAVDEGVHGLTPYVSEDLGGHMANPTIAGYIRWIEYGALSPIYRPHCTKGLSRMPWTFGPVAESVARRFVNLRYRLLPMFYAAARDNYDTGEPLLRRLDLDYPQYAQAKQNNQYLLGHSLLIAPVSQDGMAAVPASWLTTTQGQAGLLAQYFSNADLIGSPVLTRIDRSVDFNWGTGSPGPAVPTDYFSARWTGQISVPANIGNVALAAVSDDGVRVWIDDQLVIDNWGPNDSVTTEAATLLAAGQTNRLRIEYKEITGSAVLRFRWRAPAISRTVWIPPGTWINAWTGSALTGPTTDITATPLEQEPLYIRSGSVAALAPEMQFTGQQSWDPVTVEVYPNPGETNQTTLYEDDTVSTAYQQGSFRKTVVTTWTDDARRVVSVLIEPAAGDFAGASPQRSWVLRMRRPVGWTGDLAPVQVMANDQLVGPMVRLVRNETAMPLGARNGAPDADTFEVTLPASPVNSTNLIQASFASAPSPWVCRDIGSVGLEGSTIFSNSVCFMRAGGSGIGGTNDGFHFLRQPRIGDVQMTVRLQNLEAIDAEAKAGIVISESPDSLSRGAFIAVMPGNRVVFQFRTNSGAPSQAITSAVPVVPCWLRLARNASLFTGQTSSDGTSWSELGSVDIPGFNSKAYIGLAVTAHNTTTNAMAVFENPSLGSSVFISPVPNQVVAQGAATVALPFTVGSARVPAGSLVITAASSDPTLLPTAGIAFSGIGSNRFAILTPAVERSGATIVTLTASDGTDQASTEFTLTVLPVSPARDSLLACESFTGYAPGNLPGQPFRGAGFATNGAWAGLDGSFIGSVSDAAAVTAAGGLSSSLVATAGGKATVKGDGSNLRAGLDLAPGGPFAGAGLLDSGSSTIGGGNVSGTLYISFLFRAVSTDRSSEYGGLQLARGNTDQTGLLIGNGWSPYAYSVITPVDSAYVDLRNYNGAGGYYIMDTNAHLLLSKITYNPGGLDTATAWLDPNPATGESDQNSATTYVGSMAGDFSFDRWFLRGGSAARPFDFDELRFGTSWASVLPANDAWHLWRLNYFGPNYAFLPQAGDNADPDADGLSNRQEFNADTDPLNSNSCLRITATMVTSNVVEIRWSGGRQARQYLQRTAALSGTTLWANLQTNNPPTPIDNSYLDIRGTNETVFYRLKAERP